jgi:phospholipase A-2-activating protein
MLLPALDIFRMAIKSSILCENFCGGKDCEDFLGLVMGCLEPDSPPANQMLILRALCNVCSDPTGQTFLITHREKLISAMSNIPPTSNKNLQIAKASFLLNYAVVSRTFDDIEIKSQYLTAAIALSEKITDPEACYRLLVCLGTLIHEDSNCKELAKSLDVGQFVEKCKNITDNAKVSECAVYVSLMLN